MKTLSTSLYAIAHVTNPLFSGALTDGKEYPVYKILERNSGRRIVIIDDRGKMDDWGINAFTFVQK